MCFSPHVLRCLPPAAAANEELSARGDSTTATSRPCFMTSTRPKTATSSRRPPKLFFASLADTRFGIWLF
jgi:hypothetical protein